jgi:pimeloyl-ACP methyl ester carboxylesterase
MAGVSWTETKLDAVGTKLHVSRAGKGRPVVVLHHETGTLDRLPFYDALAAHYDVLVPHHPGYSRSERPDWMRSTRDMAIVYRGLLSDLNVEDAALVGLGFGGWIAAEMALMAFDRVYGAEPSVDQLEMWDICREMSFRIAWKPYMYSQTMPYLLGAVKTPTLVVWGDDDKVVPISAGKRYVAALPNAKMDIVASCGHCVDMEKPAALATLVTNFIGRG